MLQYSTNCNMSFPNEEELEMTSPHSTERLLSDYLRSNFASVRQSQPQQQHIAQPQTQMIILRNSKLYGTMIPNVFSPVQQMNKYCSTSALWDESIQSLQHDSTTETRVSSGHSTLNSSNNVSIELTSFSDLQTALKTFEDLEQPVQSNAVDPSSNAFQKVDTAHSWLSTEEDLINIASTEVNRDVPPAIRHNLESSQIMDVLMVRAVQHWCCIGFKVAPISVDLVKDWRKAPKSIVYCIASISLVTLMDNDHKQHHKNQQQCITDDRGSGSTAHAENMYQRQVAMAFYEQARNKLNDIVFDDMQPFTIQSYFCLSYTSNLLRLYEQQKTWGSLATIALQHVTSSKMNSEDPIDDLTLGCWFRWYYVDAWMSLTLDRDCLLPDQVPWSTPEEIEQLSLLPSDQQNIYGFAALTIYMRRYIRALRSGKLFANHQERFQPSAYYYQITSELTHWYSQLGSSTSISDLHLHLCYNSMRVVILYQFLHASTPPPEDILIDCLQTNLELLQALQQLKELGCDQSTYHHMFFAIHNTAKRIYQYNHSAHIEQLKPYAKEQLQINLMLLKSTPAYAHDVFKIKMYALTIQDQFLRLNITLPNADAIIRTRQDAFGRTCFRFKQDKRYNKQISNSSDTITSFSPALPPQPQPVPLSYLLQPKVMLQCGDMDGLGPQIFVFKHEKQRTRRLKRTKKDETKGSNI